MKRIASIDGVTRTFGNGKVILEHSTKDGKTYVTTHSDNAYDLYEREQGRKTGRICFTVTHTIKTLDKKQIFKADTIYRIAIGRTTFAKLFGYSTGHSIGFLNALGIRTMSGKLIGS